MGTNKRALASMFASYGGSDSEEEDAAGSAESEGEEVGLVGEGADNARARGAEGEAGPSTQEAEAPTGPAVHIGLVGEEEEASERVPTMTDRLFPDVHIPTAVEGDADDELQTRITKYLELKAQGRSINAELRKSKGYRNPDFLRKIVEHFNIDEKRSHFAKDVFDPTAFPPEDYYDKIMVEAARKAEQKQANGKREFVSSGTVGGGGATLPKPPSVGGGLQGMALTGTAAVVQQQQAILAAQQAAAKAAAAGGAAKRSKWDQ